MAQIYPLIHHFLQKLSEKQIKSLTSDSPDEAAKILLAEVVLEAIKLLTDNMLAELRNIGNPESEEKVVSTISQLTFQSLGVPQETDSVSSRQLANLIAEEVQESVSSALPSSSHSTLDQHQHFTRPNRVTAMVKYAAKMITEFKIKMKPRQALQTAEDTEDGTDLDEDTDSEDLSHNDDSCLSSEGLGKVPSMASRESRMSADSFKSRTSELLQDDIQKELREIIDPLLDDMPDYGNEKVKCEISEELKSLSDNISEIICVKEKIEQTQNVVREKMKLFFAKCFAKVWIHRLLNQLKKKHQKQTKVESPEFVESLVESISTEIQMTVEEQDGGDERIFFINDHPSSKTMAFLKQLSSAISSNFLSDNVTRASHADMSADIQRKMWVFMVLMNWWMTTHVNVLHERVNIPEIDNTLLQDAAEEAASKLSITSDDEIEQDAAQQMEEQKTFVKVLIEMFLWKLYRHAKMVPRNSNDINNWLFESVWEKVKDADLDLTPETLKIVSKKIFKIMCHTWSGPNEVLFLLKVKNPVTDACILSIFEHHLKRWPKQPNAVRVLFSSLGKRISRVFGCRNN